MLMAASIRGQGDKITTGVAGGEVRPPAGGQVDFEAAFAVVGTPGD
jgi:hypothetical protein